MTANFHLKFLPQNNRKVKILKPYLGKFQIVAVLSAEQRAILDESELQSKS